MSVVTLRGLGSGIAKGLSFFRLLLLAIVIPYGSLGAFMWFGSLHGPASAGLGLALGFIWWLLYMAAAIDLWVEGRP